ncbi:hypothetical protein GOP47_0018242 [Adiantum capillus-veneris]|uniref:Uncharacterized protein n=1 Tax=Adiantum capillus-veneris TaxID=13818 RepID=A0A9D4UGY5_ADICA|nr:hypothetical protein GOP47_0018242 [Adiantum capillus-veneris]
MTTQASSRGKLTFTGVVATPPMLDNHTRLQHEVERLCKENQDLKQKLAAIEVRLVTVEKRKDEKTDNIEAMLTKTKAEVEITLTKEVKAQVQEAISHKINDCVTFTLR